MENELRILDPSVTIEDYMKDIILQKEDDDSFYVLDLGTILDQHKLWKEFMPTVHPFYAVKCNDCNIILETLSSIGVGFDCASMEEIKKVLKAGAEPEEIIYANPSKPVNHLKFAASKNVSLMTFDSEYELYKIKKYYPNARLVLRIKVDSSADSCLIAFGGKFGAEPCRAGTLLEKAVDLELQVHGLSFHVGTGCMEPNAFTLAIKEAARVFMIAREIGIYMEYLDIGGGFPGDSPKVFAQIANNIESTLREYEKVFKGVKIIAEPGRYFSCKSLTLAAMITCAREKKDGLEYFINNGIFTSFNSVITERAKPQPSPLEIKYGRAKKSTIWGQTMEEQDKVSEECWLPAMKPGDWLIFSAMGAYSSCCTSCTFYGFGIPAIYPMIHKDKWSQLKTKRNSEQSNQPKAHLKLNVLNFNFQNTKS